MAMQPLLQSVPWCFTLSALLLVSCSQSVENAGDQEPTSISDQPVSADAEMATDNPLLVESTLPFHYPHFDRIKPQHFATAFAQGMAEELAEIDTIVQSADAPSFANTVIPLERSGRLLSRVNRIFSSLTSAHTNDELEQIRTEITPKLAAHRDAIALNGELFKRIKALYDQGDELTLDAESRHLLGETYHNFVRAGALLNDEDKATLKSFNTRLSELQTQFQQNVLKEVNDLAIVVDDKDELAGLEPAAIEAAATRASEQNLSGKYVIPLLNTSGQPVLSSLQNRPLRQRIHTTSLARGSRGGEFDNRDIVAKIMRLRAERAQLLGFNNHAEYKLDDQTAKTVAAVNELMVQLVPPAVVKAKAEASDLQALIDEEEGEGGFPLAAWDWAYYSEKVRQARYQFDESQLRPYLELNSVLKNGVFYAATQLYGITFEERFDLPVYQEDVRVFNVFDRDGKQLAIFIGDYYARPSKRGGAWMNAYVSQSDLLGTQPVVANHLNIPKPVAGEPTLLTWDEVETMFHEFGHALHGMFSNVQYPSFAGTSVPRDFVEYPSQVNEMWAAWPEVLANYARHYQTGEPMDKTLLDKLLATQNFNQGFASTELYAATLLDQAWHQLNPDQVPDADGVLAFEKQALVDAGVDFAPIPPRYRTAYFSHIMGGYDAGYYSYTWSQVLDADSVEWFKENGGLTRKNGDHFRQTLLSKGGSEVAMTLFENFRGRAPSVDPLLRRQGIK